MFRIGKFFLAVGLVAMLAACGGVAPTEVPPTATVAPTATTAPPTATAVPPTATVAPTNTVVPPTPTIAPTVAPTATVAPTRAATTAPAAGAVTDSSGKCRMTPAAVFKANSGSKDTYSTADSLALLTFAGTDTPGLAIDAAADAFIGGFQSVVTGYVETGRQTSKDARGDIQIVTFDGGISGQQAKGVFYFVQNNSVLCSLVALAIPPGDQQYADAAQQSAGTLEVIKGGASSSTAPIAPTVAPTRAPVATVAPTRAASAAPVAGNLITDSSGKCQMALPTNFKAGSSADTYQTADNLAIATVGGADTGGLAFVDAVNLYLDSFKSAISGYTEVNRTPATVNGGQEDTINYTGTLAGQPVKGVLYFFQVGSTFCSLSGVTLSNGDTLYKADLQAMINSLEPVKR